MFWHGIFNVCKTRPTQVWKCRDFVLLACDIYIYCMYLHLHICLFVFLSCVSDVWLSLLCCLFPVTFLWWAQCYHCCGELLVTGYLHYMHAWIKVAPTPHPHSSLFPSRKSMKSWFWNWSSEKVLFLTVTFCLMMPLWSSDVTLWLYFFICA